MNKYASQFNELIVLAKEEKSKKKGGSMAAVLKLIQDLTEFENSIQEAMDAQEMAENKGKIEAFLKDIDRMYEELFNIAKAGIQAMRTERAIPVQEETMDEPPAPAVNEPNPTSFSAEDLKRELDMKPKAPVVLSVPKSPSK